MPEEQRRDALNVENEKVGDLNVFIVDDSEIIRKSIGSMLSEIDGVAVCGIAADVSSALKGIGEKKPDAVILDVKIPGGNGFTVLEHIKSGTGELLVIVLTNFPYPEYRQKAMDLSADYFFDKSEEFEKVAEVITEKVLAMRKPCPKL
jgi:two-component system, OmpR family, response regulator